MNDLKRARKIIKKSARKDKKLVISDTQKLTSMELASSSGAMLRSIRSSFKPELQLCVIPKANLYPRRPEQLLSRIIWRTRSGIRIDSPVPVTARSPSVLDMNSPFIMHELNLALRKIKSAKAPGPNKLVGELYKHAPYILRMYP